MTTPQPNDPLVVRVMREFRQDLARQEAAQQARMTTQWLEMEASLMADFEALAAEIARLQAAGDVVTPQQIIRLQQYKALQAQIRDELADYNSWAAANITANQASYGSQGIVDAIATTNTIYASNGVLTASFDRLPISAIESMIGLAGDGSPLRKLLADSYPDAVEGLLNALRDATLKGLNPRETARAMAQGFGVGLDRSLLIARTEQLRVYREAGRMQYQTSGVVTGYKRICARQQNTCLACLMADGTIYELETSFEEHPNGRCTLIPIVKGLPATSWLTGKQWFENLPPDSQQSMMGDARYQAWQEGAFSLDDLVTRKDNKTWGASLVPTPLKDLVK